MSRKDDIKKLIVTYNRHLQKLKEQMAGAGPLHTPAHILIEIEDIEAEIENLEAELKVLENSSVDLDKQIAKHRAKLVSLIEDEASQQEKSLGLKNYIENYIQLNGSFCWGPDYSKTNPETSENLLKILHSGKHKCVLVYGLPGSGKTVALKRLAWELAQDKEKTNAIPIIVKLDHCKEKTLTELINFELKKTGHLFYPENFAEKSDSLYLPKADYYFLLDGLNEISPDQREQEEILEKLKNFIWSYPQYPIVITSRPQNEILARQLDDQIDAYIAIQPLENTQVENYLFKQAERQPLDFRIQELARIPMMLAFIKNILTLDNTSLP